MSRRVSWYNNSRKRQNSLAASRRSAAYAGLAARGWETAESSVLLTAAKRHSSETVAATGQGAHVSCGQVMLRLDYARCINVTISAVYRGEHD